MDFIENIRKFIKKIFAREFWVLWLIFIIALVVRVFNLENLPQGFYIEEMTNTYVGRFILLFGRDLYGHFLPLLYFDKFGDYPPVLPLYFSGISTFIFGVNEFAGRFPIALMGALFVFPMYSLGQFVFKNKTVSLFMAFIAAIVPWHVVLSRTTSEGIIALTFFALALLYVLKAITENKKNLLILSIVLCVLTYFLYPSFRVLTPLTFLPLYFFVPKEFKKMKRYIILTTAFFFVLTIAIASTPWGRARFEQTSFFSSKEIAQRVATRNQILSNGSPNVLTARIFDNKIVGYTREFAYEYLAYFSPKYLFLEGGGQARYYNVPDQGLFYLSLLPLFALALFIKRGKSPNENLFNYFVYLLVIAPLPAALTVDFTPHVHRSIFMIVPLIFIAGFGLLKIAHLKWKRISIAWIMVLFVSLEFIYFFQQYAIHGDQQDSVLRNVGDREMQTFVNKHKHEYNAVYMSVYDRNPIYYLFYANEFSKDFIGRFGAEMRFKGNIDNIKFADSYCPSTTINLKTIHGKILTIESDKCKTPKEFKQILEIDRKDGTVAYRLFTFEQK